MAECDNCGSPNFENGRCADCNSHNFLGMYLFPFEARLLGFVIVIALLVIISAAVIMYPTAKGFIAVALQPATSTPTATPSPTTTNTPAAATNTPTPTITPTLEYTLTASPTPEPSTTPFPVLQLGACIVQSLSGQVTVWNTPEQLTSAGRMTADARELVTGGYRAGFVLYWRVNTSDGNPAWVSSKDTAISGDCSKRLPFFVTSTLTNQIIQQGQFTLASQDRITVSETTRLTFAALTNDNWSILCQSDCNMFLLNDNGTLYEQDLPTNTIVNFSSAGNYDLFVSTINQDDRVSINFLKN